MNERITERIMRMGIEHRSGVPLDKLWDLATKQIKEEDKKAEAARKFDGGSFDAWKIAFGAIGLAFAYVSDKLEIIRVNDFSKVKFIEWRTPTMPLVELVN